MIRGRCYRIAYTLGAREDRGISLQMRDGDAAQYLTVPLAALGYEFESPIFNHPAQAPEEGKGPHPFDLGFLRPEDLILLVTRAPMDDLRLGDNKAIRRSYTELEERLFKALHRWFETCGRSQVELTDAAAAISPEIAERQCMLFFQNGGASYKNYGPRGCYDKDRKYFENRHRLTPAFLVYEEHAWPGGPGLLAAFSIGGPETLAWCRQLAKRFSHLLCKTPFVMAEMHTKRLPTRPDTIAFADSWEVRLLGGAPSVSPPSPLGAGTLPLAGAPRGPGLEAAPVPAHAADPTTTARTLPPSA